MIVTKGKIKMENIYSKEILEKIREIESQRADQKSGIENKTKGNPDNAAVEINEYGFPYVVFGAK